MAYCFANALHSMIYGGRAKRGLANILASPHRLIYRVGSLRTLSACGYSIVCPIGIYYLSSDLKKLCRFLILSDLTIKIPPIMIRAMPVSMTTADVPKLKGLMRIRIERMRRTTPPARGHPYPLTLNASRSLPKPMIIKLWYRRYTPRMIGRMIAVTPILQHSNIPIIISMIPPTIV